jgi:anthranilate synthase component 2
MAGFFVFLASRWPGYSLQYAGEKAVRISAAILLAASAKYCTFAFHSKYMKIVVIDNYDSFTHNLVHYLEAAGCTVTVLRNDEFDLDELEHFDKILLSPGPGIPDEAGLLKATIKAYAGKKSIFGICLGQQAIAEVFGGELINLSTVHHGVAAKIKITDPSEPLFADLPSEIEVGRYHSWTVCKDNFPEMLQVTSIDKNGEVMSLRHRTLDIAGVQFHPESILTPDGKKIIENWLQAQPK